MFKYIFLFFVISFSSLATEMKKDVTVVTSFYPVYITSLNILDQIPGIKLVNLTKNTTGCLHDYQLTPQDMVTLSKADYFIVNGGGMEAFLEKVIKSRKNLKVINASQGIKFMPLHEHEGHREHGHEHEVNPHVWLSPTLLIEQIKNISTQLGTSLPEHRIQIEKNAQKYIGQVSELKKVMTKDISLLKQRDFITFHEAFPYFAYEFNFKITDVIERDPGTEPSSKELALIIKKLKTSPTKVIFAEPQYSAKAAFTIAKESGAKVFHLDPLVSGDLKKDAYLEGMKRNLDVLKEALH